MRDAYSAIKVRSIIEDTARQALAEQDTDKVYWNEFAKDEKGSYVVVFGWVGEDNGIDEPTNHHLYGKTAYLPENAETSDYLYDFEDLCPSEDSTYGTQIPTDKTGMDIALNYLAKEMGSCINNIRDKETERI